MDKNTIQIIPKNGMFLTQEDNSSFSDLFSECYNINWNIENSRPLSTCFVVTENCNLACTYCYEKHKTSKVMDIQTAKKVIDQLLNGSADDYLKTTDRPAIILEFIGGEPLLEIELISEIVEYFKQVSFEKNHPWAFNYMISISSNGVLYFEPQVQDFLKRNAGKVSLGISVDGDKELHDSCRIFHDGSGSYDLASKAAKDLLRQNPYAATKATLSPANINYLFQAIKSLREEIGYHFIHCNCVFEEGWTLEHAKIFYSQLIKLADYILDNDLYSEFQVSLFEENLGQPVVSDEADNKNWCGGNGEMLAIDCDGKFFSCLRFMKFSLCNQEEQPIGDMRNGFLFTPKQKEWCNSLKSITADTQSLEDCKKCSIKSGCAVCIGYNYDEFGDPNHRATYICIMHKARVCANAYYWNNLYKKLHLNQEFICNTENIFV